MRLASAVFPNDQKSFVVDRFRELKLWKYEVAQRFRHALRDDERFNETTGFGRRIGFTKLDYRFYRLELDDF
jgi:hypothetical protein